MYSFRKYRAWHKEIDKMLYPPGPFDSMLDCRDSKGEHVDIMQKTHGDLSEMLRLGAHVTWDGRWYVNGKLQDVVWMQYTGLCVERSGKEIFDGDILKHHGRIGFVRYESDSGGYILEFEWHRNQHHELLTCDVAFESEHLGNVYENPDIQLCGMFVEYLG